jgi:hypothetical protein
VRDKTEIGRKNNLNTGTYTCKNTKGIPTAGPILRRIPIFDFFPPTASFKYRSIFENRKVQDISTEQNNDVYRHSRPKFVFLFFIFFLHPTSFLALQITTNHFVTIIG